MLTLDHADLLVDRVHLPHHVSFLVVDKELLFDVVQIINDIVNPIFDLVA